MMRSLYAGVSGLQNHQIRTDVIGNNIANVNTNGFKKGRVNFQDLISQTMQGASSPTNEKGGINAKQVGLGVNIASIDTLMTQGSLQTTGRISDLAVQGEGFFILRKGDQIFYTRQGNYNVDRDKFLVNPANGLKLQGWNAEQDTEGNYNINTSKSYEDIKIPLGEKMEPKSTSEVIYKCNLNSAVPVVQNPDAPTDAERNAGSVWDSAINVYDKQGNLHKMNIRYTKVSLNEWKAEVTMSDSVPNSVTVDVDNPGNITQDTRDKNKFFITFDNNGAIRSIREANPDGDPDVRATGELDIKVSYRVPNGDVNPRRGGAQHGDLNTLTVKLGEAFKFNGITQDASQSTTKAVAQDGYTLGYLSTFKINEEGVITGVFTNGQARQLAQISVATFINPGGLEKAGESTFVVTSNSGIANVSPADTQGKGKIISGTLEMSNVDLAEEFTNMIVTQRGFQANSRVITNADQLLQELLTLKR